MLIVYTVLVFRACLKKNKYIHNFEKMLISKNFVIDKKKEFNAIEIYPTY